MKRFTWNKPSGLLLIDKKGKYITLSNHCMVRNKHLKNDMKKLTILCYQMSSKSIKKINVFI